MSTAAAALNLDPTEPYTVRRGDYLYAIARATGTKLSGTTTVTGAGTPGLFVMPLGSAQRQHVAGLIDRWEEGR